MPHGSAWHDVIRKALERAEREGGLPAVGTVLHGLIEQASRNEGLPFPPRPDMSFKEFLLDNMEAVWVIPRVGQDFIAVPPNRADLVIDSPSKVLRSDLFKAFTMVRSHENRWYSVETDEVVSIPESVEHPGPNHYRIPDPSYEDEIRQRGSFINSQVTGDLKETLREALEQPKPLTAFSKAVHDNGLIAPWKLFRVQSVAQRIRDWSASVKLPWGKDWIVVRREQVPTAHTPGPKVSGVRDTRMISDVARRKVAMHLCSLSDDDIRRINVPLDLVMKIFG